jgi:hypothetical protein
LRPRRNRDRFGRPTGGVQDGIDLAQLGIEALGGVALDRQIGLFVGHHFGIGPCGTALDRAQIGIGRVAGIGRVDRLGLRRRFENVAHRLPQNPIRALLGACT